ncbi:MAG: AP2 domain-containing protein [Candidatus Sulfotelmatobacter sp.]
MLRINVGPYVRIPLKRRVSGNNRYPAGRLFRIVAFALISRSRKHLLHFHWSLERTRRKNGTVRLIAFRMDETATGKRFPILLHRSVAEEMGLDLSQGDVMHYPDADGLNCTDENLCIDTTGRMNHADRRKTLGTSRFKGVYWYKQKDKWCAQVRVPHSGPGVGKQTYLGLFTSEVEAAKAYDAKARELFGCYARLNFPGPGERSGLV